MKRQIIKITLLGLFAVALALVPASINAQDAANPPAQTAPKKHSHLTFHGKVAAVDAGTSTLTVGNLTLEVSSTARITNATNGEPAILSDITIGQYVSGSYKKTSDGKLLAQTIHIGSRPHKLKKSKPVPAQASSGTNAIPN